MALATSDASALVGRDSQHLGGGDDRFSEDVGLLNQFFLHQRDLLQGYLYTEVTSGHHDAVGLLHDRIEMPQGLMPLDLGDDGDIGMMRS
jgi:hypothetical protein